MTRVPTFTRVTVAESVGVQAGAEAEQKWKSLACSRTVGGAARAEGAAVTAGSPPAATTRDAAPSSRCRGFMTSPDFVRSGLTRPGYPEGSARAGTVLPADSCQKAQA